MNDNGAVDLIRREGVGGLGFFDGCVCCNFSVRGVNVDVSCRKSSAGITSVFQNFYGISIRITSHSLDFDSGALQAVAREVVSQLSHEGYDIAVRYADYDQDTKCKCVSCGKPRESSQGYLCEKCLVGTNAWGDKIADEHRYEFDGIVYRSDA